MKIKKKFTLIELLVVIAIIAVLVALLLPMINNIRNRAIKTKAKAEMNSIVTAVKSYEMTYGLLPIPPDCEGYIASQSTHNSKYEDLVTYLTNVEAPSPVNILKDSSGNYNGRGIRFLDVPDGYTTNGFRDPWGKDYSVLLDTDYDGQITGTAAPVNGEILYGTIFVYTWVGEQNPPGAKDYVYSWK